MNIFAHGHKPLFVRFPSSPPATFFKSGEGISGEGITGEGITGEGISGEGITGEGKTGEGKLVA